MECHPRIPLIRLQPLHLANSEHMDYRLQLIAAVISSYMQATNKLVLSASVQVVDWDAGLLAGNLLMERSGIPSLRALLSIDEFGHVSPSQFARCSTRL